MDPSICPVSPFSFLYSFFFSSYFSAWIISDDLASNSLILSSAWSSLMLNNSSELSVQVLHSSAPKSVCFFLIFSISLLQNSYFVYASFSWARWTSLWWLFWILFRSFIYLCFFRVSFWKFILFLWLGHCTLLLCVPGNFVLLSMHLKKHPPLPVFTNWLHIGKNLHHDQPS